MASPADLEDRAARFCHEYNIHAPVNPLAIAHALDWTALPWVHTDVPPRPVRGREPIYHCSGRRGVCPHKPDGCDSRDQAWQVMRALAGRELRPELLAQLHRSGVYERRHVEHFARAVLLPADEFLEDLHMCQRSVTRLWALHQYAPEAVVRERMVELGAARLSLVVGV